MLDEAASLGDPKDKLSIYLEVKSVEGNWRLEAVRTTLCRGLSIY
jgi:hypothetical protein